MARSLIIAVTGATGFLGPYLVKEMVSRGFIPRLLVRSPQKAADLAALGAQLVTGDLSAIPADFAKGADALLHMAGLIKAPNDAAFFDVNEKGTAHAAQAAEQAHVPRFIYLSSQAAGQPQLSAYAASKRAGEAALTAHYKGARLIIRAPAVFGPGDKATAPFFKFMRLGFLPVPGGAGWENRKLSLIFAPDLAREITDYITQKELPSAPVTPAGLASFTWPEFAEKAGHVLGRKVRAVPLPVALLKIVAGLLNIGVLRRMFNPHLTLGKVSEFLYEDWSAAESIENPTPFDGALKLTMTALNAPST